MAALDKDKPLPSAPHSQSASSKESSSSPSAQDLTRFTVETRAHIRQFLRHALTEEGVDAVQDWATSLELALKELCESISRGGWLSGVKAANDLAIARRAERRLQEKQEREKSETEKDSKKKGKAKEEKAAVDAVKDKDKDGIDGNSKENKSKELTAEERTVLALAQIQEALDGHLAPANNQTPSHLLLMLSPKGAVLPLRDIDVDIVPSSRLCVFTSNRFVLPSATEMRESTVSNFIYGLEEWDVDADGLRDSLPKVIGGTFSFTGLNSSSQYRSLAKVLRLSIYVCLSLILEQHVLSDSHVRLHFPPPVVAQPLVFSYTSPPQLKEIPPNSTQKSRIGKQRSGLWNFLTKKTENLIQKSLNVPISASVSRSKSLETKADNKPVSRPSVDSLKQEVLRPRRLSLTFQSTPPRSSQAPAKPILPTFASALAQISATSSLLSSSAGMTFPLPRVIVKLADREKEDPSRRLYGFEKSALSSVLGWEGRDNAGKGMSGLVGFARHQCINFLYSEYAPRKQEDRKAPNATPPATDADVETGRNSSKSSRISSPQQKPLPNGEEQPSPIPLMPCGRARWISYRYFNRNYDSRNKKRYTDTILGDTIRSLCSQSFDDENRHVKCDEPGCEAGKADHKYIWIHNELRITAEITRSSPQTDLSVDDNPIFMWESCSVCQKTSERRKMSNGTFLFSFAKYLELMIYSPTLCVLNPPLCEHTTPPPHPWPSENSPPSSRLNIIRTFEYRKCEVKFRTTLAPSLFELHIPRLQILRGRTSESALTSSSKHSSKKSMSSRKSADLDRDKSTLRKEIRNWWQSVSDHLDKLDERFSDDANVRKALPRLPSDFSSFNDEIATTPKASTSELSLRESTPGETTDVENAEIESGEKTPTISKFFGLTSFPIGSSTDASPKDEFEPSECLSNLRYSFQRSEQQLYAQLSQIPNENLNRVRQSFADTAKGASLRLSAWKKKHFTESMKKEIEEVQPFEPEWWKPGCHAAPGSKVIVREEEWGSVIAYTLSSEDYVREIAIMSQSTKASTSDSQNSISESASTTNLPTFSSIKPPEPPKTPLLKQNQDPDNGDAVWYEPESYTTTIFRYDQPKDQSGILSLREVIRNRKSLDPTGSTFLSGSKFNPVKLVSAIAGSATASPRVVSGSNVTTPPSAWAEPAVQVSTQAVGGQVSGLPETDTAEKILQDVEASVDAATAGSSVLPNIWKGPSMQELKSKRPPSLISIESDYTTTTEGATPTSTTELAEIAFGPSTLSSVPESAATTQSGTTTSLASAQQGAVETESKSTTSSPKKILHERGATVSTTTAGPPTEGTSTSVASTLTSTMTNAMRYLLNTGDIQRPSSPAHHHKLLALESQAQEDRPHIKHEWTVGKRLRFSCTVYYAKQFEILRKRCGVQPIFIQSLERSENWAAEGGKSRSNFWKTFNDRFVIKSLVNAWNVADLQVLIELAPSYFRYMESTASRPSVLAKLLGFYTIEIKNLESGSTQAKADLLVMENVFYDTKIGKTFDLKGIQGRRVKVSGKAPEKKTLFDGDWIEDQQKGLILVHADSKFILQEAIKYDAEFLCRNNIMDYSLLLGVDEDSRQMTCGLIDMIGSYTFFKTLEYKAKQNLTSGKETTVIPPNEYHDRFVNAMSNYFLACPDKWSRLPHDSSDAELSLPSVL